MAGQRLKLVLLGAGLLMLTACQSLHEELLAANYPPAFADGYAAGCRSGRAAAGALGQFDKAVTRYMGEPLYAQGWDDGFRQCQDSLRSEQSAWAREDDRRDREWRQHVDQAMAKALRR